MTQGQASAGRETPRWALLLWAGFSILMLYAIVLGGGWMGMYTGAVRLLNVIIIGVALVAWLIVAVRRPAWRPATAIWPAFVAAIAAFALSVMASRDQRIGLEILALAVVVTALYLLLVRILALPFARARIGGLVAAIALVMGGAYVVWSVLLWVEWWGLLGELRFPPFRPMHLGMTWGSPSVVLTVQVLMTAAAVGGIGFQGRGPRLTVAVLVTLLALVAFISGSRSGWLSLGGAAVIVGVLLLLDARGRGLVGRAAADRRVRLAAVPVLAVAALVAVVLGPAMIDRFGSYGDGGRPTYWATALRMFEDAPLLGQGPGTWMVRRTAFTNAGELDLYQPHAHNQYLQTAAELGVVGLLAGLVAFAAVAWLLYRALRRGDAVRRRWAWASLFGLVYLSLNVMVDVHTIMTVALLVAIPIAVLDATAERPIGLPGLVLPFARSLRVAATGLLLVATLGSYLYLGWSEATALQHGRAVLAAEDGDWAEALAPALAAADADPDIGAYQMTAALALAAAGDWEAAEAAFGRVVEIDGLPTAWLGLATAQAQLGRPDAEVQRSLEEALRLGDQQEAITLGTARLYDRLGLTAEADDAYVETLAQMPSLAADPAWRESVGASRFDHLVEQAIARGAATDWEIALMADELEQARALASARSDAQAVTRFIDAWAGDAQAVADIQAWADAAPMNATRLAYAARVSDRVGDLDAANRYRRLTRLGPHYAPFTVNGGLGVRDPAREAAMGTATYYYGTYTYRRRLPIDLLPPGEPGLVIVSEALEDDAAAAEGSGADG